VFVINYTNYGVLVDPGNNMANFVFSGNDHHPVSGFDPGGRNVTGLPNSLDFGDILKFGTLGAGVGCAKGPNSGDFAHIVGWNTKSGPCIGGALGAALVDNQNYDMNHRDKERCLTLISS
jgi:hypothetical protein